MLRNTRMKWILVLSVILMMENPSRVLGANATIVPGDFIDNLFQKYGKNGTMSRDKFSSLMRTIALGKDKGASSAISGSLLKKCFSPGDLLNIFSLNVSSLNKANFKTLCPAIVQQIENKSCTDEDTEQEMGSQKESKPIAWGYGFLSVTIISCLSLIGAFVIPFMNKDFYEHILLFMVSLAVGVLGGSSIFHLLPKTLGVEIHTEGRLFKCAVLVGGIYFFFMLEYIMRVYIRYKDGKCRERNHVHGLAGNANAKDEIPGLGVAEVQLGIYKLSQDPKLQHTAGGLVITNQMNDNPDQTVPDHGGMSHIPTDTNANADLKVIESKEKELEENHILPVAWMIIIGDGVHNFIDGLVLGAAFSTSAIDGLSTSLAILCEELPHELGDFAVLLSSGMTYKQALGFNFLSALSCFLGLIVGLFLGYATTSVKWIYALTAGMFLYISLVDMLQEATEMSLKEKQSLRKNLKMFALQGLGMLLGFAIMFIIAMFHDKIKEAV